MDNGTLGEIRGFAGNFAPRSWALCEGQLMSIAQNQALFSILGTTYGGDGRTTFGLPDLRGRVPIGTGNGPGLSNVNLGQRKGSAYNVLTSVNLPPHTHSAAIASAVASVSMPALADEADASDPTTNVLASAKDSSGAEVKSFSINTADVTMKEFLAPASGTVQVYNQGSQQQQYNVMPSLSLNYIICLFGTFPSRS